MKNTLTQHCQQEHLKINKERAFELYKEGKSFELIDGNRKLKFNFDEKSGSYTVYDDKGKVINDGSGKYSKGFSGAGDIINDLSDEAFIISIEGKNLFSDKFVQNGELDIKSNESKDLSQSENLTFSEKNLETKSIKNEENSLK